MAAAKLHKHKTKTRQYTLRYRGRLRRDRQKKQRRFRRIAAKKNRAFGGRTLKLARTWFIRRYGKENYRLIGIKRPLSKRGLAFQTPDAVVAAYLAEKRINRIKKKKRLTRGEKIIRRMMEEHPKWEGDITRMRAPEYAPVQSFEYDIKPQRNADGRATGFWDLRQNGRVVKHYESERAAKRAMAGRHETFRAGRWAKTLDISRSEAREMIRTLKREARENARRVLDSPDFKKLPPKYREKLRYKLKRASERTLFLFEEEHDIAADSSGQAVRRSAG